MKNRKFLLWIGGGIVLLIILAVAMFLLFFAQDAMLLAPEGKGISGAPSFREGFSVGDSGMPQFSKETSVPSPPQVLQEKKIIKNGYLTLVVTDTTQAVKDIAQVAEEAKGFVESLNKSEDEAGVKHASMTLRVPVGAFSEAMEKIKSYAQLVEIEQISGQDVTEQYIDLEARLKNLKATENQYLEILQKAQKIDDILQVTQRLSEVRGQVESLEGQIKYLANQTDLSTINITLSEEPTVALSVKDFRPLTILKTSVRVLVQGLIIIFNILTKFIIVWIPIIIIAGAIFGIALGILWKIIIALKRKIWHE